MPSDVADDEPPAVVAVAVAVEEEAVDARGAAGARAGAEAHVRAEAELAAVPGHVVVAPARAAPLGRVRDPVEAQPPRDRADRLADPARLGVEPRQPVELQHRV